MNLEKSITMRIQECLLLSVFQMSSAQNAEIITSQFAQSAPMIVFDGDDTGEDVNVLCNPTHMCVSLDENYFINNRNHIVSLSD